MNNDLESAIEKLANCDIEASDMQLPDTCKTAIYFYQTEIQALRKALTPTIGSGDAWIDVKTKLPEECFNVLVYLRLGGERAIGYVYNNEWQLKTDGTVTHWKPLPKSPVSNGGV